MAFRLDAESEDGVDESCVSPFREGLRLGVFGSFIVSATYCLADGRELPGTVQVDFLGSKMIFTPPCLYAQGKSIDPFAPDVETRLSRITKTHKSRPTRWRLDVPIVGESVARSGRIARSGFVQALGLIVRLVSLRFIRRST